MLQKIGSIILSLVMLAGCAAATIGSKPSLSKEGKDGLLRERVAFNWQAMIDRDRGKMYDHYDPFFRSRIGREWFIGQEMPIYYHSFKIEKIEMQGNVATVYTRLEYSIKHMGLLGKEIKKDKTEAVLKTTWLFVDNNWFRQYYDHLTDGTFAHY